LKAYKVELLIIDFDGIGRDGIVSAIENTRYPNHCIAPDVQYVSTADIGEWDDDHPLNHMDTAEDEYSRLFPGSKTKLDWEESDESI